MANNTGFMKNKGEDRPGTGSSFGTEMKHKAQDAGSAIADKGRDAAATVTDKARDAMSAVSDKARETASNLGNTASEAASNLGQKAEDATTAVGGSMKSLAGTIRENAPEGGFIGSAGSTLADTLEKGGRYLEEQGLSGMGDDLTNLIRRNPVPALLVGIGLGYLIARATRS